MSLSQLPLLPGQLKQLNDLTRLSAQPGNLDYQAYNRYLSLLGHIRPNHNTIGPNAPDSPQNSVLQPDNGDRLDNKTDFRADQALWTQDDLPDVVYIFQKPTGWLEKHHLREPPTKPYDIYGKRLRDVPVLPDHISSKVEGWRIEAWMRLDPRVSLMDFLDRMHPEHRLGNKSVAQMRTFRFREDCRVLGWVALGKNYEVRKQQLIKEMVKMGIDPSNNSTRGMSWGLKSQYLGEYGGRVEVPPSRQLENTVDMDEVKSMEPIPSILANVPTAVHFSTNSTPVSELSTIFANQYHDDNYDDLTKLEEEEKDEKETEIKNENTPTLKRYPSPPYHDQFSFDQPYPLPGTPVPMAMPAPILTPYTPKRQKLSQPIPHTPQSQIITVSYFGTPLTLKTPTERRQDAARVAKLTREWHPTGSAGRRLQLAYLLDPEKLANGRGWIDNRGFWPPVDVNGDESANECIEADIIYG